MAHANDDRTPVSNMMTVEEKAKAFDEVLVHYGTKEEREELLRRPLGLAASAGNVDRMRNLLALGASANIMCPGGDTFLHILAVGGNQLAMQALLEHGALVDAPDQRGRTALQRAILSCTAAHGGNVGVMTTLLRYGANVDHVSSDGCTALHHAAAGNKVGVINMLVAAGADISAEGPFGRTPLHIACKKNFPEAVTALCSLGAGNNETDTIGHTPLTYAMTDNNFCLMEMLLDAGADVNFRHLGHLARADHYSALDLAAIMGSVPILELFLRYGGDVAAADFEGRTALHKAAYCNRVGAIDMLVEAGADVRAKDGEGRDERTPIHCASGNMAIGAVRALLRHGASVNAPDKWGDSPLHRAARVSQGDSSAPMVDFLLRCDADETAIDKEGFTAAEVVPDPAGNPQVLDLLARAPADKAWRRRGLVVLCRARLRKAQENLPERDAEAPRAKRARVGGGGGDNDDDDDDDDAGNDAGRRIAHRGAAEHASVGDGVERAAGMEVHDLFRHVIEFL